MGIGPLSDHQASLNPAMVKIDLNIPKNGESIWFVYHKDLKHSARIQSFYHFLKAALSDIEQEQLRTSNTAANRDQLA
jgi:hypothetical protein